MTPSTDVLIVGARCAGSVLAIHLRRKNKRVIVVDSCSMPSDQPMSTHVIGTHGMHLLDELGIGDKVRAIAPPIPQFLNGVEDVLARIEFPPDKRPSSPRRSDLDPLLVDEARAAGAEIRLKTKLVELLREGNRVIGGVVEGERGREEIRADVVVGADGRNSKVAELVGAEEYNVSDMPRAAYWGYWPRPATYATDPRYQGAAIILYRNDDFRFAFPTNTDQIVVGCGFPRSELPEWKGRYKEKLFERLRSDPLLGPLVPGEPLGDIVGLLKARSFFRQAAGPGWALVGDAGLHKDPAPGLGITDALRDARALALAISAGGDAALELYWRKRDVVACELFHFANNLGALGYNNPLNLTVFEQVRDRSDLRERIVRVQARELSPFAAFSTPEIVRWSTAALLRGRVGVVKPFLEAGKRGQAVAADLALRKRLAEDAEVRARRNESVVDEVTVDGVRSRYLHHGPRDASEAVVFVHGNPGPKDDWADLIARLPPGVRAIAPDMPGYGEADRPRDFDYTVEGYARHLDGVLRALGIERPHFVLHDFGGAWGLRWMADHPGKTASLVLFNIGVLKGYRWHSFARIWQTPIAGELFQLTATKGAMQKSLKNPKPLPDAFFDRIFRYADWGHKRAVLKLYRATRDPSVLADYVAPRLRGLDIPVLVMWGTGDPFLPVRFADQQVETFPRAQVVRLENCGHWPFVDDPDTVASYVMPFLKQHACQTTVQHAEHSSGLA